jgi:MarR family transcriptional regulator, organic hydroperoxide resistance regulator
MRLEPPGLGAGRSVPYAGAVDQVMQLALAVKALQRALEQGANEAMRPLGLTGAQADALNVLRQAGPISLKELGELLIAEGGHPSRLVDRLVESGLVERHASEEDRRRIVLSLTPEGRRLERRAEKLRKTQLDFFRELLAGRDLSVELELVLQLLSYTPFAQLIARRRALLEESSRSGHEKHGAK